MFALFLCVSLWVRIVLASTVGVVSVENVTTSLDCDKVSAFRERTHNVLHHLIEGKRGIPGVDIVSPMNVSDFRVDPDQGSSSGISAEFNKTKIYGLDDFVITWIHIDLVQLELRLALKFPQLSVLGNYSLNATVYYIRISGKGLFSMNISDVEVTCFASLNASDAGHLQLAEVDIDITVQDIRLHFENLMGLMSGLGNSLVNVLRNVIFKSIKPSVVSQLRAIISNNANQVLDKLPPQEFLLSPLFPLDYALEQLSEQMQADGHDPYPLPEHSISFERTVLLVRVYGSFKLLDGYLKGLSTIHRSNDVGASFKNGSVELKANLGFDNLEGGYTWSTELMGISNTGGLYVQADSVNVSITLGITNDTVVVTSFKIEDIRQITTDFDGLGSADFLLEFMSNAVVNVFKEHLTEVIESGVLNLLDAKLQSLTALENC